MAAPALGRRHRTFTAPFQGNAHHPRIRRGSHPEILIRPYPDFARLRPDCPGPGTEGRARWPRHEFLVLPTRTCGFGRTGGADRTEWPGLGWSGWGYGPWLGVAPPPRWGNRPGLSRTRRLRCRTLERTCCATGSTAGASPHPPPSATGRRRADGRLSSHGSGNLLGFEIRRPQQIFHKVNASKLACDA